MTAVAILLAFLASSDNHFGYKVLMFFLVADQSRFPESDAKSSFHTRVAVVAAQETRRRSKEEEKFSI